ncbi:hypothetical protein [Pseudooceanicola onchidii]|uniref:hypothetical protein n=1 Tax=Pseudooceanicola onchidii TaxID=2562279 RepID=UPI0010AAE337|nr:hypothetical protein [Pseudooceanicola onchidii]
MTDHPKDDMGLDAFFDAARRDTPALSTQALDRMTAQALAVQADLAAPAPVTRAARPSRLAQLLGAIGGWPAMATLATAGVAGLWIGAVPPAGLVNLAVSVGAVTGVAEDDAYLVDPLPGYTLSLDLSETQ